MRIVSAVESVNAAQKRHLVRQLIRLMGNDLSGCRIAVWGLAFKPNTNDMREAPSREVIAALLSRGAEVVAHDPVAMREAREALAIDMPDSAPQHPRLHFVEQPEHALQDADALMVLTEWKCFQNPDFRRLRRLMRDPLVLDGRNLYDPSLLQELGVAYLGIGRRNQAGVDRLTQPSGASAASRSPQPV
jgi:UDPglucose 6-dehydrogenase